MGEWERVLRVLRLKLGGEFNKPWLGEGLWLRTEVSEWGRGKVWALATAELLVTVLKL